MGLVYVDAQVEGSRRRRRRLRLLVDSGAGYTVLPREVWRALGLRPRRRETFTLADGTAVERSISECLIRFDGRETHTPVVLGEKGDEALLGAVTLEEMGLVLNPFDRTLRPMRLMMASGSRLRPIPRPRRRRAFSRR